MTHDPHYVAARRALLDATSALRDHLDGLVLIGAQAVYLHVGTATQLVVPPHTTDADLLLDRTRLQDEPEIAATMRRVGMHRGDNPGHWLTPDGIAVDLMAAPHQTDRPSARRTARLSPHSQDTARLGPGLACALTDNAPHTVEALDPADTRRIVIRVAGPAALLVAKTIKIGDRLADARGGQAGRVVDKDALDLFRLLQVVDTSDLVGAWERHRATVAESDVRRAVRILLDPDLGQRDLPALARRAARDERTVEPSFRLLVDELTAEAQRLGWT